MISKKIFAFMLIIINLTFLCRIEVGESSGTIHITTDGSVKPPGAPIRINGNIYAFTEDIYDEIVIERSNIIMDGQDHVVRGSGYGTGIYLYKVSNVTIRNITVEKFLNGIYLKHSSNNSIIGNNIINNAYGIFLVGSTNNIISSNILVNNGLVVQYSYQNIVEDNLVNGKPIVYLEKSSNIMVKSAGQVLLVNCYNVTVANLNLSNTDMAIQLWNTNNTKIMCNNLKDNFIGIRLWNSNNNYIFKNNVKSNKYYAIYLDGSSSFNNITRNILSYNKKGGIAFLSSSNYNIIAQNDITENAKGTYIWQSSNNFFYHNNIVNNTQQVYSYKSINTWNYGYPAGGNYWNDYTGVDANGDGIGDTPYIIDENNQDSYPLMDSWSLEEIPREEGTFFWMQRWIWVIVAILIIALAGAVYLLKKRKLPISTAPTITVAIITKKNE
jgi:parallel beta-helix repeat protein